MKQTAKQFYTAQEFAEMAGVTVRTLHHYDHVGLLKPTARSEAGYRLYSEHDLARLEQIIVLKFLGLPLKQIRSVLEQEEPELFDVLGRQRQALEEKRRRLDQAIQAIGEAERQTGPGGQPDWQTIKKIIEVIEMQENNDWLMSYYSEEARSKIKERQKLWSPELQAKVEKEWAELIGEVKAAMDEDPASPKVQALADRWRKLVAGFTGGDPEIMAGLRKLYGDRGNWPSDFEKKVPFGQDVQEFMEKALAAKANTHDC